LTVVRTLIGRTAELAALERFLDETGPRGLFVEGTAGMGKTRLWQEGLELARERGDRVLSTRPSGADARLAFAGLADLLEDPLDDVLLDLPAPQRRALRIALLLDEPKGTPPDERAVAAAFLASLRILAHEAPVVVGVDDLQWLDPASASVLAFAFRRLDAEPISLLASVRVAPEEEEPAELARAFDDTLTRLPLGPLSVGGIFELLRSRFDLKLSRPTLQRVHETAEGNPFFALELGRALRDASVDPAPGEPLPVPGRLTDVVEQRLARLSPSASETLLVAVSLARPTVPAVEAACGKDQAERDLGEAIAADVLELDGDLLHPTHPLLASIHYASASPWERQAVHARLAETAENTEERARHLALSVDGQDENAAAALEEAAERARRRGATAAAAELAYGALAATPADAPEAAHRRRLAAAEYGYASGGTARAIALLEAALAQTPPGQPRAELLWTLGSIKFEGVDTRLGIDTFREALAEVPDDSPLRVRILESLSQSGGAKKAGFADSEAYAREAAAAAEGLGDTATLARALARIESLRLMQGKAVAHDVFERAVALEESLGGLEVDYGPTALYARSLYQVGINNRARELLETLCERGRERGDVAVNVPIYQLAMLEYVEGNWDRAEELARESHDLGVQSGREAAEARGLHTLAFVEAGRGNVEAARRAAEDALVITEGRGWKLVLLGPSGGPRGALALLEISLENYEAAYQTIMPAVETYHRLGAPFIEQEFDAVEVLAALGRHEEARAILAVGEDEANATDLPWIRMLAGRARGLLAAAEGDLDAAETALQEAVDAGRTAGGPLELGRCMLALGSVQRRRRKKQAARETLSEALEILDGLGARIWAERTRREIERIGGRTAPRTALSATEAEIAALVGAGKSNHEVAAALHLSPKTVEWNLSKIYRKLGVHSRTEMAAKLAVRR
jgi:DNA-binding CsgD family transcriptional regulator